MSPESIRKAAILVSSLNEHSATALLNALSPTNAAAVREAATLLEDVSPQERSQVLADFRQSQPSRVVSLRIASADMNSPVADEFAEKSRLPNEEQPNCDDHLEAFLADAPLESLALALRNAAPRTIAGALRLLPPARASNVLSRLPTHLQADVLRGVANIAEPSASKQELCEQLREELGGVLREAQRREAGLAAVRAILNESGDQQPVLLEELSRRHGDLAKQLATPTHESTPSPMTYTFEMVMTLQTDHLRDLFTRADRAIAVLALTGGNHEFSQRVLKCVPRKIARRFRRDMRGLTSLRLRDVDRAQQSIARLADQLAREGLLPTLVSPESEPSIRETATTRWEGWG